MSDYLTLPTLVMSDDENNIPSKSGMPIICLLNQLSCMAPSDPPNHNESITFISPLSLTLALISHLHTYTLSSAQIFFMSIRQDIYDKTGHNRVERSAITSKVFLWCQIISCHAQVFQAREHDAGGLGGSGPGAATLRSLPA